MCSFCGQGFSKTKIPKLIFKSKPLLSNQPHSTTTPLAQEFLTFKAWTKKETCVFPTGQLIHKGGGRSKAVGTSLLLPTIAMDKLFLTGEKG